VAIMSGMAKKVRERKPDRAQGWLYVQMPGAQLPSEHPARVLAAAVERLDLSAFTEEAKAVEGRAGRPVTSPSLLLVLWMYGLSQGIVEATEIARRCLTDEAFRWLAGGVNVSHDMLSLFLTGHRTKLEGVFTQVLGLLLHHGLVDLEYVAQDGTRVRASASAPSFRSRASLEECRQQAALHLKAVLAQADEPDVSVGQQAAREAGARDFVRRVEAALAQLGQREEADAAKPKSQRAKGKLRTSTTDADARVMKMADGGFRPGYNVQLAVAGSPEGGPRTIVGVNVTNQGTDAGSLAPMLQQVERRTGELPAKLLADGQHATLEDVEACAAKGVQPVIAVPERMANAHARPVSESQKGAVISAT
jgi:transposase